MQCKSIFYHGFKSSIRHVHTHLPTPCFNVVLSMSGRQWESWTHFYLMVLNMWTKHKLFDFHGPITLLHLFLVSWLKKKKKLILPWEGYINMQCNNNYKLHTHNHYNYSVQGMSKIFFFGEILWNKSCYKMSLSQRPHVECTILPSGTLILHLAFFYLFH